MFINMLLAHFVADYVLQPNSFANWKARSVYGVLAHGVIVTIVTMGFVIFHPDYLIWAFLIGVFHTIIDLLQFKLQSKKLLASINPLTVFVSDQALHMLVIMGAIYLSGECIHISCLIEQVQTGGFWTVILGYVLVSMPAWVAIEFLISGLVLGQAPDFCYASKIKYTCIIERLLLVTFVLFGQYMLIPFAFLPRTAMTTRSNAVIRRADGLIIESLSSMSLAFLIGSMLRVTIF